MPEHVRGRTLNRGDNRIRRFRQTVVHPQPFTPGGDEADTAQVREMARGLRLRNLQGTMNIADADFAGHQQPQHAQPCGVRERLEQPFELPQLIRLALAPVRDPLHIFALTNIARTIDACLYSRRRIWRVYDTGTSAGDSAALCRDRPGRHQRKLLWRW